MMLSKYNLITNYHNDDKLFEKIKKTILDYYNLDMTVTIHNINLLSYFNIVNLPKFLDIERYKTAKTNIILDSSKNVILYSFIGNYIHCIIPTNIALPSINYNPIPFTIPFYDNSIKLIQSNVYYFELTIDNIPFREKWDGMNIGIGFGTDNSTLEDILLGWSNDTIGYNSIDGSISCFSKKEIYVKKYNYGDTVGAGIIYRENNIYEFFFTLNGRKINYSNKLKLDKNIYPMISLSHNAKISINFNTRKFKYNFTKHITSIVLSTNNNMQFCCFI